MYRLVDEQAAFLVIDKAPGTHVHRDGEATGLMDRLRDDTGCDTLHLVHRLDAMTSGLLLVARSADAAAALGQALPPGRWKNSIWPCRTAVRARSRAG